jgi:hypothetical protein
MRSPNMSTPLYCTVFLKKILFGRDGTTLWMRLGEKARSTAEEFLRVAQGEDRRCQREGQGNLARDEGSGGR